MVKFTPIRSYVTCAAVAVVLDHLYVFANEHFYDTYRKPVQFLPVPQEFVDNALFLFMGFALIPFMLLWRRLIKYLGRVFLQWIYNVKKGSYRYETFCSLVPLNKYEENFWLGFHYTFVSVLEILVLRGMPIWVPLASEDARHAIFPAYQILVNEQQNNVGLRFVYLMQFTYYFMELVLLIVDTRFVGNRRKDAGVMFFHHVYTVILLGFSWVSLNHRIGILVLFFHDLPDIFLPVAKCFTYQEAYVRKFYSDKVFANSKAVGMVPFVLFVVTLVIFRIVLYPILFGFAIYYADWCMVEFPQPSLYTDEVGMALPHRDHGSGFAVVLVWLLMALYPLHVFWLSLIIKMIPRVLSEQYDDVRSSYAGSDAVDKSDNA